MNPEIPDKPDPDPTRKDQLWSKNIGKQLYGYKSHKSDFFNRIRWRNSDPEPKLSNYELVDASKSLNDEI